jgi:hypothetical protein
MIARFYDTQRFEGFARKFRFALLHRLVKDKDFDLHLYYSQNLVDFEKPWKSKENQPSKKTVIPDDLLCDLVAKNNYSSINEKEFVITPSQVDKIKKLSSEFNRVSSLTCVLWSDDLIKKYENSWNWDWLSHNHSVEWTENRIDKFADYINFSSISYSRSIKLKTRVFVDKYSSKWNWEALSGNPEFARNLGESLLSNECLVWRPNNEKVYNWNLEGINQVFGIETSERHCELRPSVSSNPTFRWKLSDFEKHKSKIDLWILAYYGQISKRILYKYADLLDENRQHHTNFARRSDWRDSHPVYRNGWENLIQNKNIKQDIDFIKLTHKKTLNRIFFTGDAREGFTEQKEIIPVSKLNLEPENLKLKFNDLIADWALLPPTILNETFVHKHLWLTVIKPVLLRRNELIDIILKKIQS